MREASEASVRLFGGAMVVGPLLLVASGVAFVNSEDGHNVDDLGGALLVYAFVAMTIAAIGLARVLEPLWPRLSSVLLALSVLGCASGVGFGIDSIHAALPGGTNLEDADSVAAVLALFVPGAIFPLSFAALGVALWRARVEPAVCGPLLVVAAVLFAAGNIPDIDALLIIGDAMFVVALAPLGLARLRD